MGWLLQICCMLLGILPRRAALSLGRGFGFVLGSLVRHRRREAAVAMRRAFHEWSEAQVQQTLRDMYRHLGLTLVEIARLAARGRGEVDPRIDIVKDEYYRQFVEAPTGTLLLMGHIGNWELNAALTQGLGRKAHAIVKPLKPAGVQRFVERMRGQLGLHLLSFRGDFGEALRALRRREAVAVILDQNQRRTMGVFTDFLGAQACTSHGLAILSSMAKAPVFPAYDIRQPDGRHTIRVLPPIEAPPDREPATIQTYTQRYTTVLEQIIRQHPGQWTWIHHRWRTRPESG